MFKSVSNWLESVGMVERPSTPPADEDNTETTNATDVTVTADSDDAVSSENINKDKESQENENDLVEERDPIDTAMQTLDDVGEKAVNAAKEWGSYLFSFGKVAGQTVYDKAKDTASLLKHTMEEKTLIGDFSKEQSKFIADKNEGTNKAEAAVAPWIGYNEEEQMKSQILALSKDQRNFLRNPPSGIQFQFDVTSMHPVAMATLQEDPNLQKMRFELVPKQIKEAQFWRNYFYRVSLIKQSTQLTSLTHKTSGERSSGSSRRSSTDSLHKERSSNQAVPDTDARTEVDMLPDSPNDHEFASDAFTDANLNEDDLSRERQQLGVEAERGDEEDEARDEGEDEVADWEKELQKELQDYEMVGATEQDFDDEDIESEILQQIQDETVQDETVETTHP